MVLSHALLTGHGLAACRETAIGYDFFDRFLEMTSGYPAVVAKSSTDTIVGFAFLRPYHPVSTFKRTAELTCFIHPEHTGKKLNRRILDLFVEEAKNRNVDNLLASISSFNEESLEFRLKQGFI